eukprot:scaffold43700_cov39-Tisochrysis_lutea.AAC.2
MLGHCAQRHSTHIEVPDRRLTTHPHPAMLRPGHGGRRRGRAQPRYGRGGKRLILVVGRPLSVAAVAQPCGLAKGAAASTAHIHLSGRR